MEETTDSNALAPLTVAVVQLCSNQDVDANLDAACRFIREAAEAGARVVATPENTAFLRTDPSAPAPKQGLDGPIVSRLRAAARDAGVWLLIGSIQERVPGETQRYANTSVVIDGTSPDAPITCTYRKLHLFDIDIKGGESQRESDWIVRGDEVVCTPVAGVQTGLTICYDLRFPALYQTLQDQGARILTVPAAFTEFTGKDHWLPLLRARAIETQCFVIAANQSGHHGGKRRSYGKSTIIDPWGITLAVAPDGPGWVMARLDFAQQDRIRAALPCHAHRHPNV